MTIRDMHYAFKQGFNKIDSQQNRNLYIPEIDVLLNQAMEAFILSIAEPRVRKEIGFEIGQRTMADLRTIVVDETIYEGNCHQFVGLGATDTQVFECELPIDFMYLVGGKVQATKEPCTALMDMKVRRHNTDFEKSPFDRSSFEWRVCNVTFSAEGLRAYTDGTFKPLSACISYLRQPAYMHNAQDFPGGTYTKADNVTVLIGSQDCELPFTTHQQIVDIAVMIASGQIQAPDYQLKQAKVKLPE